MASPAMAAPFIPLPSLSPSLAIAVDVGLSGPAPIAEHTSRISSIVKAAAPYTSPTSARQQSGRLRMMYRLRMVRGASSEPLRRMTTLWPSFASRAEPGERMWGTSLASDVEGDVRISPRMDWMSLRDTTQDRKLE